MNKSIIDNLSDNDIIKIANQSKSFADFTTQIGYSQRKVGKTTRLKIKKRLDALSITFNANIPSVQKVQKLEISTEELGFLGEASLMKLAVSTGIHVCRPVVDSYPYDFILEKNGKFLKFQVKTSQTYDGRTTTFSFMSKRHTGKDKKYSLSDTDYFYLYDAILDEAYIVKTDGVSTGIIIRHNSKYVTKSMNIGSKMLAKNLLNTLF